jgi:hypothetical protein
MEHLAIFAQPRGLPGMASPKEAHAPPSLDAPMIDTTRTGSLPVASDRDRAASHVEIVAARSDRVWVRVHGLIISAGPGDEITGIGRIGAIVARDGGWALLDEKGATLLKLAGGANGAPLFTRKMIFE